MAVDTEKYLKKLQHNKCHIKFDEFLYAAIVMLLACGNHALLFVLSRPLIHFNKNKFKCGGRETKKMTIDRSLEKYVFPVNLQPTRCNCSHARDTNTNILYYYFLLYEEYKSLFKTRWSILDKSLYNVMRYLQRIRSYLKKLHSIRLFRMLCLQFYSTLEVRLMADHKFCCYTPKKHLFVYILRMCETNTVGDINKVIPLVG